MLSVQNTESGEMVRGKTYLAGTFLEAFYCVTVFVKKQLGEGWQMGGRVWVCSPKKISKLMCNRLCTLHIGRYASVLSGACRERSWMQKRLLLFCWHIIGFREKDSRDIYNISNVQ